MSVLNELDHTLHAMSLVQMLLMCTFLTSYPLALGEMFGTLGRRRAGLIALVAAVGFAATTPVWVHGAILIAFAVMGVGVFIGAVWALSTVLGAGRQATVSPANAQARLFLMSPTPAPALRAPEARPSRSLPR
jgi:hypothetical protein